MKLKCEFLCVEVAKYVILKWQPSNKLFRILYISWPLRNSQYSSGKKKRGDEEDSIENVERGVELSLEI